MASREPTAQTEELDARAPGGLALHVLGAGADCVYPLPSEGEVLLGRAEDVAVRIDDGSVSRRHARLLVGAKLQIEDLGSANGTKVGGQLIPRLTPTIFHPGEVVDLGSVTLVVRAVRTAAVGELDARGFAGKLDAEIALAQARGTALSVATLRLVKGAEDEARLRSIVGAHARSVDAVAFRAPGEVGILLPGLGALAARAQVQTLADALRAAGLPVHTGVATLAGPSETGAALMARASAQDGTTRLSSVLPFVVVDDPAMRALHQVVERVAPSAISVLLLGETGVGKEVLAEAVHRLSPRAGKPFLRLNCAAFSDQLLESELFGHEKGAFTGADHAKPGLLETAEGGTVFLDEIGELPLPLQAKLLRVLEDRVLMRVGSTRPRTLDVRFVAATNRDLEAEAGRGAFRSDLFFRLNGITIQIPPLRERRTELPVLAEHFIRQVSRRLERPAPTLSPAALDALLAHAWPGNIRELRNVIERAVVLAPEGTLEPEHLAIRAPRLIHRAQEAGTGSGASGPPAPTADGLRDELSRLERKKILDALEQCAGNQTRAAALLGISRRTLLHRLEEFDLPRPRKK